jgi:general secretion pathway protein D
MKIQHTIKSILLLSISILLLTLWGCAGVDKGTKPHGHLRNLQVKTAAKVPSEPEKTAEAEPKSIVYTNSDLRPVNPAVARDSAPEAKGQAPRRSESGKDYRRQVRNARWPGAGKGTPEEGEALVEFNFDNADLNEVIRTIAQILDIKYIADPGIQGAVTIHTAKGLSKKDLYPVFFRILDVNGLTAVKEDQFYRITPSTKAARLPVPLHLNTSGRPLPQREDVITQIIPLEHTSAPEMVKLIQPFVSEAATVIPHIETNTLMVVDKGINVAKVLRLVEAFDLDMFTRKNHRFFFLQHADAQNAVTVLKEVFSITTTESSEPVKFVTIKRLNAFLAISTSERIFNRIDGMLTQLDAPSEGIEPRIYVYSVRNGAALNLSDLLNQVFSQLNAASGSAPKSPGGAPAPSENSRNPLTLNVASPAAPSSAGQNAKAAASPAVEPAVLKTSERILSGGIQITPDEIRNVLIIRATPSEYRVIENILGRIDVLPRQVLIEATIAEIDHTLTTELGVDWSYTKGVDIDNGILSASLNGTSGLSLGLGIGSNLAATLKALERQNKVNILSSPHVLASDNQRARIDVSNEIPLVSSETLLTTTADPIVTTNIQYRDTGVMLTVTPHINERALVTMDIYQEVSEQSDDVTVAGQSYPSFFKRTLETSLTVRNGQTIVLGGLIRENTSKSNSGLPFLSRIPIIGALFGQTRDAFDKTELIILLTPRVIVDLDDVDEVTNEFKQKVYSVVQSMDESVNRY